MGECGGVRTNSPDKELLMSCLQALTYFSHLVCCGLHFLKGMQRIMILKRPMVCEVAVICSETRSSVAFLTAT